MRCGDVITTGIAPWRFTSTSWDKTGDTGTAPVYCKPQPNAPGWYQETSGCWYGSSSLVGGATWELTFEMTAAEAQCAHLEARFVVDESAVFWLNGAQTTFEGSISGGHWANIKDLPSFYGEFVPGINTIRVELTNVGSNGVISELCEAYICGSTLNLTR